MFSRTGLCGVGLLAVTLAACGDGSVKSLADTLLDRQHVFAMLDGGSSCGQSLNCSLPSDASMVDNVRFTGERFTDTNKTPKIKYTETVYVLAPGTGGTAARGDVVCSFGGELTLSEVPGFALTERVQAQDNLTADTCGYPLGTTTDLLIKLASTAEGSINNWAWLYAGGASKIAAPFDGCVTAGGSFLPYEVCGHAGSAKQAGDPFDCLPSCTGTSCYWSDSCNP
jgi:hypothetical protein